VRNRSAAARIAIQDLTACYTADTVRDDECSVDIAGGHVRVVGFPALATTVLPSDTAFGRLLTKWVAVLDTLVARAAAADKVVVVVTDMPDPASWASTGFPAGAASRLNAIVASNPVLGVVGARRGTRPLRREGDRIISTLALSADASQVDSVLGFTLVQVTRRDLSTVRFQRRDATLSFVTEEHRKAVRPATSWLGQTAIGIEDWLWRLTRSADLLAYWAVLSVAFVVAFLTVVQLWDVSDDRPGSPTPSDRAGLSGTGSAGVAQAPTVGTTGATSGGGGAATTGAVAGLLDTNVGRALGAGVSGMVLVSFLDEFWRAARFNAKAFYLVAFVGLFFAFLVLSGVWRAIQEALRHRIATHMPIWWVGARATIAGTPARFWVWVLSLRGTALVFSDTFFNVLQGRNQLKSAVWTDVILDHHQAILATAERVRVEVDKAVRAAQGPQGRQIRVNITLLSRAGNMLYYVRAAEGSLQRPFDEKSVAWLAVAAGRPLWWIQAWEETFPGAVLVDNKDGRTGLKGLGEKEFKLGEQFAHRGSQDYAAFIVIPFPLGSRGENDRARGAIHISFERADGMRNVIDNLDRNGEPNYAANWHDLVVPEAAEGAIWIRDDVTRAVMREALNAFETLFAPFDEDFFRNYRAQFCQ